MSLLVVLNILKSEEQLRTEYTETSDVALVFWHSSSPGCIHSKELGESPLSPFLAHCRRNIACTVMNTHMICF